MEVKKVYKKNYERPEVGLWLVKESDVVILSGTGFDSDGWDNPTEGEIIL